MPAAKVVAFRNADTSRDSLCFIIWGVGAAGRLGIRGPWSFGGGVVLDGEVEFEVAGVTHRPRIGEELLIPAGAPHTVRNRGTTESRWLYGYPKDPGIKKALARVGRAVRRHETSDLDG